MSAESSAIEQKEINRVAEETLHSHVFSTQVGLADRPKVARVLSWMLQVNEHPHLHRIQKAKFSANGKLTLEFAPMQYSLEEIIDAPQRAMFPETFKTIAWQMCNTLAYLHSCSLIHSHLTPDVLFYCSGNVHVGGLYYVLPQSIASLSYVSLRNYRAPEIIVSAASLRNPWAADIWSLGCILFELIARRPLFSLASSKSDEDKQPQGKRIKQQLNDITDVVGTPIDEADCSGFPEKAKAMLLSQPRTASRVAEMVRTNGDINNDKIEDWARLIASCLSFGTQNRPTALELCSSSVFAGQPPFNNMPVIPFDAKPTEEQQKTADPVDVLARFSFREGNSS